MRKLKIYLAGAMGGLSYSEYMGWRREISNKLNGINDDTELRIINPADYYNFEDPRHVSEI